MNTFWTPQSLLENSRKCSSIPPFQPKVRFIMKWSLKITLGNIKYGGMLFPVAKTAHAKVMNVPRSAEVRDPISLKPCLATTLFGLWTVVTPVSSMLQMSLGRNLCLCMTRLLKKQPTFSLLNLGVCVLCLCAGYDTAKKWCEWGTKKNFPFSMHLLYNCLCCLLYTTNSHWSLLPHFIWKILTCSWCRRKTQKERISIVISIHPHRSMNICTKLCTNPSSKCWYISHTHTWY